MDPLRLKQRPQCGLLLENARGEVLLQLRDNKPGIPYPNCWGTFGGQVEPGEAPREAILRETREELGYEPRSLEQYGTFPCDGYDILMFRCVDADLRPSDLEVREGQRAGLFSCADLGGAVFAFNCRDILQDYFTRFHPERTVFIGLGSNIGDRRMMLGRAIECLRRFVRVQACSSIYETEPVGYEDQGWFLNMALQAGTRLFPQVLLEKMQAVEAALGRTRSVPGGPRTMDLDLLLYADSAIDTPGLTVPHPRLHERAFVLAPLSEIAPGLVHPVLRAPVSLLLEKVAGVKQVRPYARLDIN